MPEPRRRRTAFAATVLRTERLSASLVRLVVGGPGLDGFTPSECTDSYVKVLFVHPDVPRPLLRTEDGRVDVDGIRDAGPAEQAPRTRSYTVRAYDAAAPRADPRLRGARRRGARRAVGGAARPGDEMRSWGPAAATRPTRPPGGTCSPGTPARCRRSPSRWSALPAGRPGHAVVEVHDAARRGRLAGPGRRRGDLGAPGRRPPGARLVEAVRALPWAGDDVHAFVHGEAAAVKELRRYLRVDRGLGLDRLSISGYWRLGVDDEGWRAAKREWNAAIEESEAVVA